MPKEASGRWQRLRFAKGVDDLESGSADGREKAAEGPDPQREDEACQQEGRREAEIEKDFGERIEVVRPRGGGQEELDDHQGNEPPHDAAEEREGDGFDDERSEDRAPGKTEGAQGGDFAGAGR